VFREENHEKPLNLWGHLHNRADETTLLYVAFRSSCRGVDESGISSLDSLSPMAILGVATYAGNIGGLQSVGVFDKKQLGLGQSQKELLSVECLEWEGGPRR
jgi:ribonuclease HIII